MARKVSENGPGDYPIMGRGRTDGRIDGRKEGRRKDEKIFSARQKPRLTDRFPSRFSGITSYTPPANNTE